METSGTGILNVTKIVHDLEDCLALIDSENDPRLAVAAAHVEQALAFCRLELAFAGTEGQGKGPSPKQPHV